MKEQKNIDNEQMIDFYIPFVNRKFLIALFCQHII
jgi:hypothetical protein